MTRVAGIPIVAAAAAGFLLFAGVPVLADSQAIDFSRDIRPILTDICFACHGPDENSREGVLRLDLKDEVFGDREGTLAVVPGEPEKSELYRRLSTNNEDERMPPVDHAHQLTQEQIGLFRRWIEDGAEWQEHWAFIAPVRPSLPQVSDSLWSRNAVDRFVLGRLDSEGLSPSPEADKTTLIRRVTLDLTGLPPTLAEIDAFCADTSPTAYDKLVDRLLSSPHYAEHMTRFWLDAARYGDTHGLHLDNERSLWPYRDWVLRAFNSNMPFDQFTIEQIAGDLLPEPTRDQLIATGFSRCNVTTGEGGAIDEEFRVRYVVDRVETMGTVWMGLTLGCAVCHEHKFDPFTQKDFYQFFAYFNNVAEKGMDENALLPPPYTRLTTPEQATRMKELRKQIGDASNAIEVELTKINLDEPARAEAFRKWKETQQSKNDVSLPKNVRSAVRLPAQERSEDQNKLLREYFVKRADPNTSPIFEPLVKQLDGRNEQLIKLEASITGTMVMRERKQPRETFVLTRGEYDKPGEKVEPNVPASLPPLPTSAPSNRLGLALWLVDPAHPLSARVAINRFWQQSFGTGIVKTAEDFGSQGEWPSHPKLLDWLACEFVASDWNVKHLQRLIVTSATYRQSSSGTPESFQKDHENRLLARGPRLRVDAETIRDSALAVSGLLVTEFGGKSVRPYQPDGLWKTIAYPKSTTSTFTRDSGGKLYRRSLYTFWKRTSPPPSMQTFDAPSREKCSVRRARTNTPLQALALMNDEQFVEAARHLATRMMTEAGPDASDRVVFAFRLATARAPHEEETRILLDLYRAHREEYRNDSKAALELVTVGASQYDETLDVAELAAWTMVANTILNLNESITKG
jgi:hypothetical protein